MPTDVSVASECKRKAAQAQTQIEITVVLIWIMIGLVMLVLLLANQSFSKATIELMCLFLKPTVKSRAQLRQLGDIRSNPSRLIAPE
jgi:hypothetical protein